MDEFKPFGKLFSHHVKNDYAKSSMGSLCKFLEFFVTTWILDIKETLNSPM